MTVAERAQAWADALLEELLRPQSRAGTPVLLACDDETIRSAAARLGHTGDDPVAQFVSDVRAAFQIDATRGLWQAHAGTFRSAPRPRPVPDFLPVLCLLVLAASRMEPDETTPTHAYYVRLRELLDIGGNGAIPHVEFIPGLFGSLADWLENDLAGTRGRLVLPPEEPRHRFVGTIVSQTVFRRRDRQVLAEFFRSRYGDRQPGGVFDDSDPLRRLRRWSGRWNLTQHALRRVHDDTVADQVRAAVRAAYQSWDGSLLTPAGAGFLRRWPAYLRLQTNPLRLHLGAGNAEEITFDHAGQSYTLEPRGEVEVPFSLLLVLRFNALTLGRPSSSTGVLWLPKLDDTVLFELGHEGLLQVDNPTADTVWVLTCKAQLQNRLASYAYQRRSALPASWLAFRKVPVEVLVTEVPGMTRDVPKGVDDFRLEEGLPLERRRYLSGPGPFLAAGIVDVDEPLPVSVNGEPHATISSGGRVALPGDPGTYEVTVGADEWSATYEVEQSWDPEPFGTLAHLLTAANALRSGARPLPDHVDGVTVSGAIISKPYGRDPPILKRGSADLFTIDQTGSLERHRPPPEPSWRRQVGLGEHVRPRWEIVRDGVVWLLCPHPAAVPPWAELQRAEMLQRLAPDAAQLVDEMDKRGRPILRCRRGSGISRRYAKHAWNSLLRRAFFTLSGMNRRSS